MGRFSGCAKRAQQFWQVIAGEASDKGGTQVALHD